MSDHLMIRVARAGKELGSFEERDVRAGLVRGIFRGSDHYFRQGMDQWGVLKDLFPHLCLAEGPSGGPPPIPVGTTRSRGEGDEREGLGGCGKFLLIFGSLTALLIVVAVSRSPSPAGRASAPPSFVPPQNSPALTPTQQMEAQDRVARDVSLGLLEDYEKQRLDSQKVIDAIETTLRYSHEAAAASGTPLEVLRANGQAMLERERAVHAALEFAISAENRWREEAQKVSPGLWGLELEKRREPGPASALAAAKAARKELGERLARGHELREKAIETSIGSESIKLAKARLDTTAIATPAVFANEARALYALYADAFLEAYWSAKPASAYVAADANADARAMDVARKAVVARLVNPESVRFNRTNLARSTSLDGRTLYCHAWGELESTAPTGEAVVGRWSVILVGALFIDPITSQVSRPSHSAVDENWKSHVTIWDVKPKGR